MKRPSKVTLAGDLDFAALDVDVIERELFVQHDLMQIEAERVDAGSHLRCIFLECHEHARLAELRRAVNEELHGQLRLTAQRADAHEGRPPSRQTVAGDFDQADDAGWRLLQGGRGRRSRPFHCILESA